MSQVTQSFSKFLITCLSVGLFFLNLATPILASISVDPPIPTQGPELLFGQNHYFSVIFRGNGEAIVYARLVINNPNDQPLTNLSFEIPKVSPTELVVFQQTLPQQCLQYSYQGYQTCIQYGEPDYNANQNYYPSYRTNGSTTYTKIPLNKVGNLYKLDLPTPVSPYKATALIISYAAKGYVQESFGLFKFNFESIKVPARINQLKVAIDVDTDLQLKGKRSEVNYNTANLELKSMGVPAAGVSSQSLDQIVGSIGNYGPLVKEAKNLAPNESFTVNGEYAKSWFRLYLNSIVFTIFLLIAIPVGIYFLLKFLKKRHHRSAQGGIDSSFDSTIPIPRPPHLFTNAINITNILMGLLSVGLISVFTLIIGWLASSEVLRFSYNPVLSFGMMITGLLFYILAIFGPAIFMASKNGWKALLVVLISEFGWFLILLLIYFLLFQSGLTPPWRIYPQPYYSPAAL